MVVVMGATLLAKITNDRYGNTDSMHGINCGENKEL
jgi:hypothetical protein